MGTVYRIPNIITGNIVTWNTKDNVSLTVSESEFRAFMMSNGLLAVSNGEQRDSAYIYKNYIYLGAKTGYNFFFTKYHDISTGMYGIIISGDGVNCVRFTDATIVNNSRQISHSDLVSLYHTAFYSDDTVFDYYPNYNDAYNALIGNYPITYRLTNCTAPDAPAEGIVGNVITVPFTFPEGYGIVNSENVYVTNNGVIVPSTYANGVLTFEMPNPN